MMIKIAITDDHMFFRKGLVMALKRKEDFEVVIEAENGQDLLNQIDGIYPDVILMDIRMPVMDGIKATKLIIDEYPDIRIVALTLFKERDYVEDMLKAGAKGFLFKNADEKVIEEAVRKVYNKGFYFSENVVNVL